MDGAKSRTQLKADHDSISTFNSPQPAITNYGSILSMSSSFSQDTRFQSVDSTMSATRPRATFDGGVDRQMSISRKDLPRSASTLIKNQYTNNTFVDNSANKRNTVSGNQDGRTRKKDESAHGAPLCSTMSSLLLRVYRAL